MEELLPKVLIVSRGVWDDTKGTSSTLTNIFEDYDPARLAHIFIETKQPNTRCCYQFFQISEISLVHKLWRWKLQTGHTIDTRKEACLKVSDRVAAQESGAMDFVRAHRSPVYSLMREILWGFNGWKSKELDSFIRGFDPDVIWLDGSPLPLMNRLFHYVLSVAKKPASIFMQDDVYTYASVRGGIGSRIRKSIIRRTVRRVVSQCSNMFVASPKMKKEYDEIFGINSIFIAKSFHLDNCEFKPFVVHSPVRLVYLGQIIYGRIKTLVSIAEAMADINSEGVSLQLSIYTNNRIESSDRLRLLDHDNVFIKDPVAYSEVPAVIADNDVVVYVETFEPKDNKVARLSFSTKISDYLRSGKCVFAIGPSDIAPIEYFKDEDAAIVSTSIEGIKESLIQLSDSVLVNKYAEKAYDCALRNHNRDEMNKLIYGTIVKISKTHV